MSTNAGVVGGLDASRATAPSRRFPLPYLVLLICMVAMGAILTSVIVWHEYRVALGHEQVLLTRASDDTATAISQWVHNTTEQAQMVARFPVIADAAAGDDPVALKHASAILAGIPVPFGYEAIYVLDRTGRLKVQTEDAPELPAFLTGEATKTAGPRTLTCFEPGFNPGYPRLAFVVPVERGAGPTKQTLGVLIILTGRQQMRAFVEPSGSDKSVRSILIARNPQGSISYLTPLIHTHNPGPGWHDELAEAAVRGDRIFAERVTGDGLTMYGVSRYLPELQWGMITRRWRAEALAPFLRAALLAVVIFLISAALLVSITYALWRRQLLSRMSEEMENRSRIEEELRQSEERFNKAFRFSPEGMSLSRLSDGVFIEVNDSFAALSEYSREELIGHSAQELGIWADPTDRGKILQMLQQGLHPHAMRVYGFTKSCRPMEVELSAETVKIQGEQCLLLSLRDITQQRLLEEQLRQAQKMEALGQLAGTVAHDFNNLLMAIGSQAELLIDTTDPPQIVKKARRIMSATESASQLTRKLLALGRKQALETTVFDLNHFVADVADLIGGVLPKSIRLDLMLGDADCWVRLDRGQIEQTVVNLVINARDAMPKGGKLVLGTSRLSVAPDGVIAHGGVPAGDYALLTVSDTGCGIPEQDLSRIFEPFFTTKPKERGTGLGLAIAYGIVAQSGGHIRVNSTVGVGTTFSIYLPAVAQPAKDVVGSCPLSKVMSYCPREGTILVVDDEEAVRATVRLFLTRSGLKVVDCGNAEEGLRLAAQLDGELAMLVTDIMMPGMTGTELARSLVATNPRLPIIFISGYAAGEDRHEEFSRARFLQKPFTRADLMGLVCERLEGCPLHKDQS